MPEEMAQSADDVSGAHPIADLTYRTYDGPLHTRSIRWWIVALAGIRQGLRKKGFWIVVGLSVLPYLYVVVSLYLESRASALTGGRNIDPTNLPLPGQVYSSRFFQVFGLHDFFLFILTLLIGTASIAADNQANALLVYLSKPITKGDYLIGKWMGVAVTLFCAAAAPALGLYIYCLLSYASDGFLKSEPWLLFRILGACAVPALIYSALIVGFSAWSKSPRMAGAFFAGAYFIGSIMVGIYWGLKYMGDLSKGTLERHLHIDGVIQGLVQNVYGVTQRMQAGNMRTGSIQMIELSPPPLVPMLMFALALVLVGLAAARLRIRAVEVVQG